MAKFPTFPTLYDDVLQLNISKLKLWGYLKPDQINSGLITWSRNGNKTGSIAIHSNTYSEQPYIELDYKYGEEPRKYKVYLTSTPSNLDNGKIWYFVCPGTGKRCRKLYSIGGYFMHREAFKGCMYECQTQSKKARHMIKLFKTYLRTDDLYSEFYKKYRKNNYAGKPTKKTLKLKAQIKKAKSLPCDQIEKLYYMK